MMFDRIALRDYVIEASGDEDFFRQAVLLGFQGVEPGPTREQLGDPQGRRLAILEQAWQDTSLEIPCLSLNHHNQGGLGSADEKIRGAAITDIRKAFGWAGRLGTRTFLIPFFGNGSLSEREDRERMIAGMKELCPEAQELGLTLAYEGDLPAAEILQMSREIDSAAFGCYYDLANPVVDGRDPVAELGLLRGLVVAVHIKDFNVKLGDCRPGKGRVPLPECAAALRQIGYQGWLTLETPPAPAEVVAGDLDYVRKVFLS